MIDICFAGENDYGQIEIIAQEIQELHVAFRPDIFKSISPVIGHDRFLELVGSQQIIVAKCGEVIVGYSVYLTKDIENPIMQRRKVLYIDSMAVKQEYKHLGIGTGMFGFLMDIADKNGYDAVELSVIAQNEAAIHAYEKWGFSPKMYTMGIRLK